MEAVVALARHMKFRPQSMAKLPIEKRAKYLAQFPAVTESIAARALVSYHLAHQRPMMGSFLDALGVAHESGVIAEDEAPKPSPDALLKAAEAIAASYPADDVALYLSTLLWQDPETWGALADAPQRHQPAPAS